MPAHSLPPVPVIDADLLAALRHDFASAPYTVDAIEEVLSTGARQALERENPIPALRELDTAMARPDHAGWRTALLTRFFTLGGAAAAEQIDKALPSVGLRGLYQLGLIEQRASGDSLYVATVDLRPYEARDDDGEIRWWIASDLSELATGRTLEGEHVLGIGGATATLIAITPREGVETALDLGCGCGIQALHAARHARRVIATDISSRAVAMTEFNVALNAPSLPEGHTIETREGSLLEPVEGLTFDLIVSNPPFVITPRTLENEKWTYRDGGEQGDAIVANLIRDIDAYLAPGGTAAMLANWEIVKGREWSARPAKWLAQSRASSLIIQRDVEDPASYSSTWIRDGGVTDRDEQWAPLMNAWLDDFASRNVTAIGFGHVLLRAPQDPAAPTFRHFAEVATTGAGPLGPRYGLMLATLERLEATPDSVLRECLIARADDVVERRHFTPGEEDPMVIDVVQGGGFGRTIQLDTHTAAILGTLTGEYPLSLLLEAYGSLVTQADPEADLAQIESSILAQVRELLSYGFLTFA